jgi:uncharacterized protein
MKQRQDRRTFVKTGLATAAGIGVVSHTGSLANAEKLAVSLSRGMMPKRKLGKTGHSVGLFSLGGQATIEQQDRLKESVDIINRALDLGVNYIDTAAAYGRGISEKYIGEVMKERRNEVFLATKTHDRSYDGTMRLFEQSLKNLQTDTVDLYQVHNVRTQEDLDRMFAKDGVIKAFEKLRGEGLVRFLGITGHRDPAILKKGITDYEFDCILMALNAADIHHAPFQYELLQTAVKKELGIIAMKIPARGRMFRDDGVRTMKQALGYVYSFPISTAIVGISTVDELEENISITHAFSPLEDTEKKEIEQLTAHYYEDASWYKYQW